MDRSYFFDRNLLALSTRNPSLCSRLSGAQTTLQKYKFLQSVSGETVPALIDHTGTARPLHSMVDPKKEADRLVSVLINEAEEVFIIFLGLGAGLAQEAALNCPHVSGVLVIDYDINGMAELLSSRGYIPMLGDPRFTLVVDPSPEVIKKTLFELYRPALNGGIRLMPLRIRADMDRDNFGMARDIIQETIDAISSDYSVQAHFGMRWFANIIRNLNAAQIQNRSAAPIKEAVICAAGPSLDVQIPQIQEQASKPGSFIISADTALGALLYHGITPHAIVSIDCQHISYYHFIGEACRDIPLFLDIASPHMLSHFSDFPFFFSGGHPLAAYISRVWRPLPPVDTSGGNVTYACLSLAESLGAARITVYGADFSYPLGRIYARGTYVYPYFEHRQERRVPLEAQRSSFLYRSPFVESYQTATLRFYREGFVEKASAMQAEVRVEQGLGSPIIIPGQKNGKVSGKNSNIISLFAPGKVKMTAADFLEQYSRDISALPEKPSAHKLTETQRHIITTLLPQAAAIKHRHPELSSTELIETVKRYCCNEIDKLSKMGYVQ